MKNKIIIALIFILMLVIVPNAVYAAKMVPITKANLKASLEKIMEENGEENASIAVYDKYFNITSEGLTSKVNYSINDNKLTFWHEANISKGMSYDKFEEQSDLASGVLYGYLATADMQKMDMVDALFYLLGVLLENTEMSTSYMIVSDGTVVSAPEGTIVIYESEFGNRVMEYVNGLYGNGAVIDDSNYHDIFEYSIKLENVTNTSCTLVTKVVVDAKNIAEMLKFEDVDFDAWYYDAVKFCYNNGIILGTSETTFEPNTKLTRGMVVTILYRVEGIPTVTAANKFSDVASSKYYYNAVRWASSKGIVNGYSGTKKFGPNDPVTRQDLAVILSAYANYKGKYVKSNYGLSKYPDSSKISSYAKPAMQWAVKNKIMNGSKGNLNPKGTATRAEAATMLYSFCLNIK